MTLTFDVQQNQAASMPTNEIWACVEIVPNSNFAHRARSSQVNMLCIIDKYRLYEFHLNALAGQKGEFCDWVTLGTLYKIHHTRQLNSAYAGHSQKWNSSKLTCSCSLGILCLSSDLNW